MMRLVILSVRSLLVVALTLAGSSRAQDKGTPKHLNEAVTLVKNLKLEDTKYQHGEPKVEWKGLDGATKYTLHTDCSGFIDALLMHTYGYEPADFKKWFGKARPTADVYHDTIADQKGFTLIERLKDAKAGDILAVKYAEKKENTGHVMLLAETPRKVTAKKPILEGTEQWEMNIIDSSSSGHGLTDTRHKKGDDGKDHTGLGQGIIRVYTSREGKIAGWTWSTLGTSAVKDPKEENLVVGRLKLGFKPE